MSYQVRSVFCNDSAPVAKFEDGAMASAMYAHDLKKMLTREAHKDGSHITEVRYIQVIENPHDRHDPTILITTSGKVPCPHN